MVDAKEEVESELEIILQEMFDHLDILFEKVDYTSADALEEVAKINLVSWYRQWIYNTWETVE